MISSAEKSRNVSAQPQQQAAGQTFFRKAGEPSFLDAKQNQPFFAPPVQAKLNVSSPDDPQEKEADAVADRVMRMPDAVVTPVQAPKEEEKLNKKEEEEKETAVQPSIMRKCATCESEDHAQPKLMRMGEDERKEEPPAAGIMRMPARNNHLLPKAHGPPADTLVQCSGRAPPASGASIMRMNDGVEFPAHTAKEEEQLSRKEEEDQKKTVQPSVMRKCAACEKEEHAQPKLMRKGEEDRKEEPPAADVMRKATSGNHLYPKAHGPPAGTLIQRSGRDPPESGTSFESALQGTKGGGSALPGDTRQSMESRFGADFSGVRIHTGTQAESLSSDIHAQAFTHGNDIYFNSGKYSPGTAEGGTLLAHELTHTIQQGASIKNSAIQQKSDPLLTSQPATAVQKKVQLQSKLEKFSKPGHGENANKRLKNDADRQRASERQANNGELREGSPEEIRDAKRGKKQGLRPIGTPEINESRIQVPKITAAKSKTKEKIEKPKKNEQKSKQGGTNKKLSAKTGSENHQARSGAAKAIANSLKKPAVPNVLQPVSSFLPKDVAGKELPVNQQQFNQFSAIGSQIQDVRNKGHELIQMGVFHEQQSHLIESQVFAARSVVAESDNNLHLIDQGIDARREAHQQGTAALQVAETKQQTVEAALPQHIQSIDSAKSDSTDAAAESRSLQAESASNEPEDPEDRANSQEMGSQIGEVSNNASSIDQMFLQSQQNVSSLSVNTQQAKVQNTNTRTSLQSIGQQIGQITTKSTELKNANLNASAQINNRAQEPMEVRQKAIEMKLRGELMVRNSLVLERRMHDSVRNYQKNLAKIPALYEPPEHAEGTDSVNRKIQRAPLPGDYGERIDVFQGTFLDPATHLSNEQRQRAQREADVANQAELDYINRELPGDFASYGAWTRIRVGLGAKINRFTNWISNLGVAGVLGGAGMLLVNMFNPMTYVHGVVSGFTQVVNGVVNLAVDIWNGNFWGAVKSLADIATGVAVIAGTITGLALVVELAMTALLIISAIFSFGASAAFIIPVMVFAGEVMVVAGEIALWAGGAAVVLNLIAGIKSLVDMGNAESAEQLQAETNDFTQDMGGVANGLLSMLVGKAGMGGPARIASTIQYAAGIGEIALASGSGAAARAVGTSILTGIRAIPGAIAGGFRSVGGALRRGFNWVRDRFRREPGPVVPPREIPPIETPAERTPTARVTELPPEDVSRLVSRRSDGTFRLNRKNIRNVSKIVGEPEANVAEHAAREAYAAERAASMDNVERVYMGREADRLINPDVPLGTELSADVVGVTRQGRFVLIEAKGTEILHGLEQLEHSAQALGRAQVVRYELVVAEEIRTPGFSIRNGILQLEGRPYLINGKPVHVRTTTHR